MYALKQIKHQGGLEGLARLVARPRGEAPPWLPDASAPAAAAVDVSIPDPFVWLARCVPGVVNV